MNYDNVIGKEEKTILETARKVYGDKNQISVAAEECCELAAELLKFLRYDSSDKGVSETREKVMNETTDVIIILDHVVNIFGFTEEELTKTAIGKILRVKFWLDSNHSLEYSTKVRDIPKTCDGCFYIDHWDDPDREKACKSCARLRAF